MKDKFIDGLPASAALDVSRGGHPGRGDPELLPDEAALLAGLHMSSNGLDHDEGQNDDYGYDPEEDYGGPEGSAEDRKRKKLSSSKRKSKKIAAQARELEEKEDLILDLLYQVEMLSGANRQDGESVDQGLHHDDPFGDPRTPQDQLVRASSNQSPDDHAQSPHTRSEQAIAETIRGIHQEERELAAYTQILKARQEREQLAREQFEERLDSARPTMPDYDDKVEALLSRLETAQVAMPNHVVEEIHQNQNGPELLYLMAGDDGFLMDLMQSDPVSAAREIGRREALLSSSKQKLQSGAPAPRQSLKGGSSASRDPESMSYTDYRKWRGFDRA